MHVVDASTVQRLLSTVLQEEAKILVQGILSQISTKRKKFEDFSKTLIGTGLHCPSYCKMPGILQKEKGFGRRFIASRYMKYLTCRALY